jgi:predicted RNA-binding Zn ribbon-like protein
MTNLTYYELISLYLRAKDKDDEVFILAQLTASDVETIIEVLKDADVYEQNKIKQCIHCKEMFIDSSKSGRIKICPTCQRYIKKVGSAQFYRKLRGNDEK